MYVSPCYWMQCQKWKTYLIFLLERLYALVIFTKQAICVLGSSFTWWCMLRGEEGDCRRRYSKALVTSVSNVCLVSYFIWPNGVRYDKIMESSLLSWVFTFGNKSKLLFEWKRLNHLETCYTDVYNREHCDHCLGQSEIWTLSSTAGCTETHRVENTHTHTLTWDCKGGIYKVHWYMQYLVFFRPLKASHIWQCLMWYDLLLLSIKKNRFCIL